MMNGIAKRLEYQIYPRHDFAAGVACVFDRKTKLVAATARWDIDDGRREVDVDIRSWPGSTDGVSFVAPLDTDVPAGVMNVVTLLLAQLAQAAALMMCQRMTVREFAEQRGWRETERVVDAEVAV